MRALVACEFSGRIRDELITLGVDAVSCDLLPTEKEGPHYQGDVRDILYDGWDMMIAHPPCTTISKAGVRWLHSDPKRWLQLASDCDFFNELLRAPIPKMIIENPIPHRYATEQLDRKYDQIIHPWQHGHLFTKATCLWLKNVDPIQPTNNVKKEMMKFSQKEIQKIIAVSGWNVAKRKKQRSITCTGIAKALASQLAIKTPANVSQLGKQLSMW